VATKQSITEEESQFIKWLVSDSYYSQMDDDTLSKIAHCEPQHISAMRRHIGTLKDLGCESLCMYCSKCFDARYCDDKKRVLHGERCEDFSYGRLPNREFFTEGVLKLMEAALTAVYEEYTALQKGKQYTAASRYKNSVCKSKLFALCGVNKTTFEDIVQKLRRKRAQQMLRNETDLSK